jgi:hypothetical protein
MKNILQTVVNIISIIVYLKIHLFVFSSFLVNVTIFVYSSKYLNS